MGPRTREDVVRAIQEYAWLGTAVLIRAQDPHVAGAVLTADRYADIEVHSWQFGGRPS